MTNSNHTNNNQNSDNASGESRDDSRKKLLVSKLLSSYVVCAALLFVGLEAIAGAINNYSPQTLNLSPYKSANRSWVWWNVRDFSQLTAAPDIVLLGSSLMMAPLHGGDAVHLNFAQNVPLHHKSQLLEDLLKENFNRTYHTFAFALGGEMISDAWAISDTLLKGDRKPKVIIYGVAPRDFMDSALPSPSSTEIYKYMSRIGDLSAVDKEAYANFWQKAENSLGKVSFTYKHRPDFLYVQHRWAKELFRKLLGYKELELVNSPFHVRKQAFSELPEDNGPGSLFVDPPGPTQEAYVANLDEYRHRYRRVDLKLFNTQLSFLERLLALSEKENIRIVLVNMPLTEDNVNLMPPGFYQNYLDKVTALSTTHKALLLNLNDPKIFPQKYFTDSVHLNSRGGEHFFQVLADRLKADPETATIISQAGTVRSSLVSSGKITKSALESLQASGTVDDIIEIAGQPRSDIGSGIHILTYPLEEGGWALVGSPDMKKILYIHYQLLEPKSAFAK
ncbi:hypothetical protein BH11CYA1_BH11CYA1_01690 [soil metagenome]